MKRRIRKMQKVPSKRNHYFKGWCEQKRKISDRAVGKKLMEEVQRHNFIQSYNNVLQD
jgi:hypothetical protein